MKIVYLHQYFNTPDMPGSTRSYEMARRLVDRGHEVCMVTSWREKSDRNDWFITNEAGIQVHWLPVPYDNTMRYSDRIKAFFRFAYMAARKAAGFSADVIFATSTPLTIVVPGFYAAYRSRIPMVFEVRDLWPEVPIELGILKNPMMIFTASQLENFAYKNSTRIVALAPGMAESIIAKDIDKELVSIIPNGCDVDLFDVEPQGSVRNENLWLGDGPLVVYAGTLGLVNGVSYLADVAKSLETVAPEIRIVVIGMGKEYDEIRDYAKTMNVLGKNFFMLGSKSKKETARWIAAADMTTSMICNKEVLWKNAVTNKFFDSMAAGTPIACNHAGWQTEIAEQEGTGIFLEPDSPAYGAKKLATTLRDSTWLTQARHNAKQLALGRFSRDRLALQLEEILTEAVSSK